MSGCRGVAGPGPSAALDDALHCGRFTPLVNAAHRTSPGAGPHSGPAPHPLSRQPATAIRQPAPGPGSPIGFGGQHGLRTQPAPSLPAGTAGLQRPGRTGPCFPRPAPVSDDGAMPATRSGEPGRARADLRLRRLRPRVTRGYQGRPPDLGLHPGPGRSGDGGDGRGLDHLRPDRRGGGVPLLDEVRSSTTAPPTGRSSWPAGRGRVVGAQARATSARPPGRPPVPPCQRQPPGRPPPPPRRSRPVGRPVPTCRRPTEDSGARDRPCVRTRGLQGRPHRLRGRRCDQLRAPLRDRPARPAPVRRHHQAGQGVLRAPTERGPDGRGTGHRADGQARHRPALPRAGRHHATAWRARPPRPVPCSRPAAWPTGTPWSWPS